MPMGPVIPSGGSRYLAFAVLSLVACAGAVVETDDDSSTGGSGGGAGSASTSSTSGGGEGGGGHTCNDGYLDPGEFCDQTNYGGSTCESLGYAGGELACDPLTCEFDFSGCLTDFCGNDEIDGQEECDGTDLGGATCTSIGTAGGTIACDDQCLFTGCHEHYTQDFEGTGIPPGWTTSGSANWAISTTTPHGGAQCAESGTISHSQSSSALLTLTFDVAGTISFWHRESTESCCDELKFFVDASMQDEWAGSNSWASHTFNVTAGSHNFEWRYDKDSSVNTGSDTVCIDDVSAQNGYLP
ncbi:MAG: hypothetical protein JRI68_22605 [Deltaproteobacteria bacterium]|nr:hypothetical protein [Deltaproteobacteria bacterium]